MLPEAIRIFEPIIKGSKDGNTVLNHKSRPDLAAKIELAGARNKASMSMILISGRA